MIYEEHGLTSFIAFDGAMKKAGIEVILQIANPAVTTDVICTVDTTKHDADELRKFIDYMAEHTQCSSKCENFLTCDGKKCWNKYLDMYEKEQK